MRLVQGLWAFVTTVFHIETLSTVNNANLDQSLLSPPQPPVVVEPAASRTIDTVPSAVATLTTPLGAGPTFHPPGSPQRDLFRCEYPEMVGWEECSTVYDRSCWLENKIDGRRYDLFTNYENDMPIGITRYYSVNLTEGSHSADGWPFTAGKFFNGTYPGPWIEACWGDTIVVNVTNYLPHNGTSVHWHGVRQNQTMHMDGVNGVTQCPIAPGDSFVYKFNITQYGSSWYHSHYSVQYADGAVGALTFHGPTSAPYDAAISPPLIMTDWTHGSAFDAVSTKEFVKRSILLNGRGNVTKALEPGIQNKTEILPPFEVVFEEPKTGRRVKRYLLRLINTSFDTTFVFSIDHHMLQIVSADFVPIFPYANTSILIGIGQRYNVIVEANPLAYNESGSIKEKDNYWIRTYVAKCTDDSELPKGSNYHEMGILRYDDTSKADPTTSSWDSVRKISRECSDETYGSLHPILPWKIKTPINGGKYGEKFDLYTSSSDPRPYPLAGWSLNNHAEGGVPMRINYSNPIFLNLDQNPSSTPWVSSWRVVTEDYSSDDWVFLAITAPAGEGFMAHPIHLHGHDFALVEQGYDKPLDPWNLSLKLDNPPRRDVVLLPKDGYVIIAFKADNPGAWLIHCHIAFHISEGLGLQIMERQRDANAIWPKGSDQDIKEAERVCKNWRTWQQNEENWDPVMRKKCTQTGDKRQYCFQDDSGV